MGFFAKLFGKRPPTGGLKSFADRTLATLYEKYDDFVYHIIYVPDVERTHQFLGSLSFTDSGTTPEHIQVALSANQHDKDVALIIGGRLTRDENYEVFSRSREDGLERKSVTMASDGSPVLRAFLEAASSFKEWS